MTFFSGFSLKGEEELFDFYIDKGEFCVSGFSLGAIDAFEDACQSQNRIDKLQLFSPAFFQEESSKFKRLQEIFFQKDKISYVKNFLENISYPSSVDMQRYYHDSAADDLQRLLHYYWSTQKLEKLREKDINIEVYLGGEDKIIDSEKTKAFFQPYATVIMIKNVGHILKEKNG